MSQNNLYNYKTPKSGNEETGFFNIKGRITRKTFFLRLLFSFALYVVFTLFYTYGYVFFGDEYDSRSFIFFETIYVYILPLLLIFFILIQGAKRIHDVNKTGWYFLIPIYNLYLIFCKGSFGTNEFGIDPKPARKVTYFDEIPNNQIVKKINEKADKNNKKNSLIANWVVVIGVVILIFSFSLFIYYKLGGADEKPIVDIAVDSLEIAVNTPRKAFPTTSEVPKDTASADGIHLSDDVEGDGVTKLEHGPDDFGPDSVQIPIDFQHKQVFFKNSTENDVYLAIAYSNNGNWESIGWYKIIAGATTEIDLNDSFIDDKVYWYAYNLASKTWPGKWLFCINSLDKFHYTTRISNENCKEEKLFNILKLELNKTYHTLY